LGAQGVFGEDVVGLVRELTAGRNTDSVIEAVGTDSAIQTAVQLAGRGGTVAVAGVPASITLDLVLQPRAPAVRRITPPTVSGPLMALIG
jgi:threonine dehydrogenase-like Zn-dependent dehydrogenase